MPEQLTYLSILKSLCERTEGIYGRALPDQFNYLENVNGNEFIISIKYADKEIYTEAFSFGSSINENIKEGIRRRVILNLLRKTLDMFV